MKHKWYYGIAAAHGVLAMLFLCMVDNNIGYGIMAVVCLISAVGWSDAGTHEEMNMNRQIRAAADEDRPE